LAAAGRPWDIAQCSNPIRAGQGWRCGPHRLHALQPCTANRHGLGHL